MVFLDQQRPKNYVYFFCGRIGYGSPGFFFSSDGTTFIRRDAVISSDVFFRRGNSFLDGIRPFCFRKDTIFWNVCFFQKERFALAISEVRSGLWGTGTPLKTGQTYAPPT